MIQLLRRGIVNLAPRYPKGTPLVAYVHPDSAAELATPEALELLEHHNVTVVETAVDGIEPGVVEVARA